MKKISLLQPLSNMPSAFVKVWNPLLSVVVLKRLE